MKHPPGLKVQVQRSATGFVYVVVSKEDDPTKRIESNCFRGGRRDERIAEAVRKFNEPKEARHE